MVERQHRQLKAAIRCHNTDNWVDCLPLVLLGIRTAMKEDLKTTSAELVYGQQLSLPGEFFTESPRESTTEFINKLRRNLQQHVSVNPKRHGLHKPFVPKDLKNCSHVFQRRETVIKSLQNPYDGPYKVITRNVKTFKILINNQNKTVSIDRLKPAFVSKDNDTDITVKTKQQQQQQPPNSPDTNLFAHRTTAGGRKIRPPVRFRE